MNTSCPKCTRQLSPSGIVVVDGREQPVYQCPECLMRRSFLNEPVELALTFILDVDGRPIDPADPDMPLTQ